MKRTTLAAIATGVAFSVAGCATQPGQQNPGGMSNTGMGAIIGTLGGAAAGVLIGDSTKGALIGAAAGAAIGAGTGYYMDRQKAKMEESMRQEISSGQMELQQRPDKSLVVTMNEEATFAFNSSKVKPAFYPAMNKVAQVLGEYDKTTLKITGYTDNVGSDAYNLKLSQQRASAVKSYLTAKGIAASRISTVGMGKANPRAGNDTAQGRAMNRRVDILIQPTADAK